MNELEVEMPDTCGTLTDGAHNGGGLNGQDAYTGRIIPVLAETQYGKEMACTLTRRHDSSPCADRGQNMVACIPIHDKATRNMGHSKDRPEADGNGNGLGVGGENDPMFTVTCGDKHAVAVAAVCPTVLAGPPFERTGNDRVECEALVASFEPGIASRDGGHVYDGISGTLRKEPGDNQMTLLHGMSVRRLTPLECERLQGFPDNHTRIPWRGKPAEECPDGPRYKAIGNSWAVNCAEWIGRRLQMVDDLGVKL